MDLNEFSGWRYAGYVWTSYGLTAWSVLNWSAARRRERRSRKCAAPVRHGLIKETLDDT